MKPEGSSNTYGYIYAYTRNINIKSQASRIIAYCSDSYIFKEKYIGIDIRKRMALKKIKKNVIEGDTVVFDSITCLSTSIEEAIDLYFYFFEKNIDLVFLKEPSLNTGPFKTIFLYKEHDSEIPVDKPRDFINEMVKEKISLDISAYLKANSARLSQRKLQKKESYKKCVRNGKKPGWKKGKPRRKKNRYRILKEIVKLSKNYEGVLSNKQVARLVGISTTTYYKYVAILEGEYSAPE